jgi:transcriptional regulator CtsR
MAKRRTRFACYISKYIYTHSEYVILIALVTRRGGGGGYIRLKFQKVTIETLTETVQQRTFPKQNKISEQWKMNWLQLAHND